MDVLPGGLVGHSRVLPVGALGIIDQQWLNVLLKISDSALFRDTDAHLGRKGYVFAVGAASEGKLSVVVAVDRRQDVLSIVGKGAAG